MTERERREFLVVGAGSAGLAAAIEAARAGVDTCVVDLRGREDGSQPALRNAEAAGVEVRLDTSAWGIWGRSVAVYSNAGGAQRVVAEQVLLATGARPRPIIFPGWRLPGVTFSSAGVSGRVVLAGSGPHLAARAMELQRQGVNLRAVIEAAAAAWDAHSAASWRRQGVSVRNRHLVVRAEGRERVEQAVVARVDADWRVRPGSESAFDADALVLDYGNIPCSELSRLSGCSHRRIGPDGLAPVHDEWMRTDVPGLLVAGNVCGVCEPAMAVQQGRLAGIAVALELGRLSLGEAQRRARPVRTRLQRLQFVRDRAWSAYRIGPGIFDLAQPDTVVCHCEGVAAADVQAVVFEGSADAAVVRGETRAGMGICQARDCGRQIEALVAQSAGVSLEVVPPLSVRPPVVPIPLGALADALTA